MSLSVSVVPVTPLEQNCSILVCNSTKKAALVDPGGDPEHLLDEVQKAGGTLSKILLTHGHVDHVGAAGILAQRAGVPIEGPHFADKFWLDALAQQSQMFGLPFARPFTPERWLVDGDKVEVGEATLEVLHCPGHTPGHIVFYIREQKLALVGDVLFYGSIGRTDFPQSNHGDLISSIKEKLWPLGNDVEFISGHGPNSSFGQERKNNAFVADGIS